MIPIFDLIATVGGLIIPPITDFIRKKWLKPELDTPEATAASLAMTKPDILPSYIDSITKLQEVTVKVFNRDVIGNPSLWVVDLRAAIRPAVVVLSLVGLLLDGLGMLNLAEGVRISFEGLVSSWFGSRLVLHR